ncbi:MAG: hypothetical protein L6Q84_01020 [Polyangiaceae bacterium]|nr:hypothetical protein [Polyangiaceae bacterium]
MDDQPGEGLLGRETMAASAEGREHGIRARRVGSLRLDSLPSCHRARDLTIGAAPGGAVSSQESIEASIVAALALANRQLIRRHAGARPTTP